MAINFGTDKKPESDGLKELAAWVSGLYMEGTDTVDVLELMKKLRELRKGDK